MAQTCALSSFCSWNFLERLDGLWQQAVPVRILCVAQDSDAVAQRHKKALEDSIQLSGRFTLWEGAPFDIPKEGVVIDLYSIEIEMKDQNVVGSALVIQANVSFYW